MYCGGCFHDNTLVAAARQLGHAVTMVPLYLPLTLDESDQSRGTPIFFSGINVFLEEKIPLFRRAPAWLHKLFASPKLLGLAAGFAGKTRADELGELTVSMLRGEEGNQARELDELIAWLQGQSKPELIGLSNALLLGLARQLKRELKVPVVCSLQGEDYFLDSLPDAQRDLAWQILSERTRDIDLFIAPSRYFADLMSHRLNIATEKMRVVYNGINLAGFQNVETDRAKSKTRAGSPTIGFFARMCHDKGLDTIVETFILLRERGTMADLKLKIGGGCGPSDEPMVEAARQRLKSKGLLGAVEFFPNVTRPEKIRFLESLDVFCTPALYGEAFGLYVIEAMAAGVPVVEPRDAAFPEIIEATGGGIVTEPNPSGLAEGIESLILDPTAARALGAAGQRAVFEKFNADRMARKTIDVFQEAISQPAQ
jgi:glycosyltransferase involved in cell wall biosynthesis